MISRRTSQAAAWEHVLRESSWYTGLGADVQGRLMTLASVATYRPGHYLFRRGEPPCGIYAVVQGIVHVYGSATHAGVEPLMVRMQPGTWLGEVAALDGLPRCSSAVASGEVRALHVAQNQLDTLLVDCPRFLRDLGRLMASKLRAALGIVEDVHLPLRQRLARRLLSFARAHEGSPRAEHLRIKVAQDKLASLLMCTRTSINRTIGELVEEGTLATARGEIVIVDLDALRSIADFRMDDVQ
ncbi:MAG: putative regulatory protein [Myxococcaceae bacterium]|nr:putative regulatory protein [Myxococcaceae bacterium]